jgi:DNA-binding beta-propeller fold protein YncE
MQDIEAFRDNGAGGVGVGDGAECCPGGDGEEKKSAKPHDEGEPDDGAEQSLHAQTGYRVEGAGYREQRAENVNGSVTGEFANQRWWRVYWRAMKRFFAVALLMAIAGASVARSVSAQTLLVANQGDRTVSLIDAKAGTEVATIAEDVPGQWGHEIAASADGRKAYLPIYGNSGVGKPGIDGSKLLVIDVGLRQVTGVMDFGHGVRPHLPVMDSAHGVLYVTTELDDAVTAVDPAGPRIVGKIPTGQKESHMLALSHDGKLGYTANVGPGTVSVLDLMGRRTLAVIPVTGEIQRIAISRDDKWVFTSDVAQPRLAVIDTAAKRVKTWVDLPGMGYGSAVTPDGRWLLVAIPSKNVVAVVDVGTMQLTRTVNVAADPQEVLIRPDGQVAYVSCMGSGQVAAVNLATWKTEKLIDAGKGADGLGWAPR